jgi:hypothetical protein
LAILKRAVICGNLANEKDLDIVRPLEHSSQDGT